MKKALFFYLFFLVVMRNGFAQNLKPTDKLALLKGVVTNFKNVPLSKETIIFLNEKTKSVIKVNTGATGKFEVLVPVDVTYVLKYKNFTTDVEYTKMTVPADKEATYEVGIKIELPKDFILDNVYFDTGKSTLKPNSNKALNDLVEVLKLKTTMLVEIQGHTDNVGKEDENLKLSQERAEAVKKYLVLKGVEEKRITAKGYGSGIPIADNNSDAGKSKNRRTSLKVIKE